jgi:regulator of CtrA degradation
MTTQVHRRLIDALYGEAMLLADEARSYFDQGGRAEREALDPMARVSFSCESLKVTTRLMHVIAWLLTQKASYVGEMSRRDALDPSRRLGPPPITDAATLAAMPDQARQLVQESIELFRRTARLDDLQANEAPSISPARSMLDRLENAF